VPLTRQVRLGEGQTVLVHAAAGGVGTATIQVARALGARVVAAAGSAEKLELCRELGAEEAYVYDELPDDLRVDVVVDPVGGELFEAAVPRLRPLGTLVAIGYAGGLWPELQPSQLVGRNVGVQGVYIGRLLRHAPDVIAAATRELLELWSAGTIRPVVGAELPLAEVEEAHELVESRRSVGKVVLVP
jgi:NADPH2:quinone reductase